MSEQAFSELPSLTLVEATRIVREELLALIAEDRAKWLARLNEGSP